MKKSALLLLFLACLLPALACNLPTAPRATPSSRDSIQRTLDAMNQTAQPQDGPDPSTPPSENPPPSAQPGLPIVTAVDSTPFVPPSAPPTTVVEDGSTFQYVTRPGDTPAALALRFGVPLDQIFDPQQDPPQNLLPVGQQVAIPNTLGQLPPGNLLLPDSEVVYSPSSAGFSVQDFVQQAAGYLSGYSEQVDSETMSGAQIIQRVADETSTNPRLLLAVLEYRSHWVYGTPDQVQLTQYPIGFYANQYAGLYKEITLTARQLTLGYYGWRAGSSINVEFANHTSQRINPTVNAGTAALQYLFAKLYSPTDWPAELYNPGRFIAFYHDRFGDPWQRAVEPLLPDELAQPELALPFPAGERWSFTGGPHAAWGVGSPLGGLDFAPASVEKGCTVSHFWATAAADGVVVRSGYGQLVEDLDGDGREQTGWVLLYLHVAEKDRLPVGTRISINTPIGHPSCEGGFATGSHVHIARKYNGEWFAADGPVPFVLSGWQAWAGGRPYAGTLTKESQVVTAQPDGSHTSSIVR